MSRILLVSGHPSIQQSQANRNILEAMVGHPAVTAVDISMNYPDLQFDVEAEQQLLKDAELVIIQSPIYWYGLPAHVRLWIEKVFCYGFAFGPGGDQLHGKSLLLSLTLGGTAEAYTEAGAHQHGVEFFLEPIRLFSAYCGMQYLDPVYSNNMSVDPGSETFKTQVSDHVRRLRRAIRLWQTSLENAMFQ